LGDALYREYSIPQGRWISPDPAGLAAVDPSNPQSWNRYAYVRNNPLALVDPTGTDCAYLNDSHTGITFVDTNTNFVDCTGNGGYWLSGQVNQVSLTSTGELQFGYSGMGPNGNFVAITYNNYLGPNTDNSWFSAAAGAAALLDDFLAGTGSNIRHYDMNDIETRSLMQSKGVQQLNLSIQFHLCGAGEPSGEFDLRTKDAALNLPYDAANSPTGVQVGGYAGATWQTVGPGVVSVTIPNDASLNSFALHVPPSYERSQHARAGTIHQTFQFNEPFSCGE
jgi:RHS repeat-associated protein